MEKKNLDEQRKKRVKKMKKKEKEEERLGNITEKKQWRKDTLENGK